MSRKKVVVAANSAWYIANFRSNLCRALIDAGYEVVAVAPDGPEVARIQALGARFTPLSMKPRGLNPISDLAFMLSLRALLKQERPGAYLSFTIKPNIYGGIACRSLGVRFVPNISGLGSVFISNGLLSKIVKRMYRVALAGADRVFFQNPDDVKLFMTDRLVDPAVVDQLPGSGVDTTVFHPQPAKKSSPVFCFLLPARMIWEKGVGEFITACELLGAEGRQLNCQLLGALASGQRGAIPKAKILEWESTGLVKYLGFADDVRPFYAAADCIVLPSYREGTPRAVLEAASMAKPVITTDVAGCRQTVDDGLNGLLCNSRDAEDLAQKMRMMMDMHPAHREEMGLRGREKMMGEFDESIVLDRYVSVIALMET